MKAERRHQLKENSLAHALAAAPFVLQRYATQILLGILIVVLAVVLIRNRAENARQLQVRTAEALTTARSAINQLPDALLRLNPAKPEDALTEVRRLRDEAENRLNVVIDNADDRTVLAEARIARGDLNWQLANLPELTEAATRPTLKLDKSDDQYLQAAADAYNDVLRAPDAPDAARLTARLSLAAIAENRRKWDEAKTQYQSVIDDPKVAEPFKAQARERVAQLDQLKVEPFVGKPATAPAQVELPAASPVEGPAFPLPIGPVPPMTLPAATQPATNPTATPSTTAPATSPATAPAPTATTAPTPAPADKK